MYRYSERWLKQASLAEEWAHKRRTPVRILPPAFRRRACGSGPSWRLEAPSGRIVAICPALPSQPGRDRGHKVSLEHEKHADYGECRYQQPSHERCGVEIEPALQLEDAYRQRLRRV